MDAPDPIPTDTSSWPHFPKATNLTTQNLRVPIVVGGHPVVPLSSSGCAGCLANTAAAYPRPLGCADLPICDSIVWAPATPENLAKYVIQKMDTMTP